MTSDERREVAERLRSGNAQGFVISVEFDAITTRDLADLIDPTCTVESSIFDDTCECESPAWGYRLSCGHWLDWGDSEPPSYCTYCGCRIEGANGDE